MSRITNTKVAYGKSQGLIDIFNAPIVSLRDPNGNDKGSIGQLWTNKVLNTVWMLTSFVGGSAIWAELDNTGAITGIVWSRETGAAVAMTRNHGYINANAGLTTFTLPLVAPVGTVIEVMGEGVGGWRIAQNAGQSIRLGNRVTTVGIAGFIGSTHSYTSVNIITRVADTVFEVVRSNDNVLLN